MDRNIQTHPLLVVAFVSHCCSEHIGMWLLLPKTMGGVIGEILWRGGH